MHQSFIESAMVRRGNMMMSRSWKWSRRLGSWRSWIHPQVGHRVFRCRRGRCQSGSSRSSSRLRWIQRCRRRRCVWWSSSALWGSGHGPGPNQASCVSVAFVLHRRGNRKNGGELRDKWVWVKQNNKTSRNLSGLWRSSGRINETRVTKSWIRRSKTKSWNSRSGSVSHRQYWCKEQQCQTIPNNREALECPFRSPALWKTL